MKKILRDIISIDKEIILTRHATERIKRGFGLSDFYIKEDVRKNVWNMYVDELGELHIYGKVFNYPIAIDCRKVIVKTILFKKKKKFRVYQLSAEEVKDIFLKNYAMSKEQNNQRISG